MEPEVANAGFKAGHWGIPGMRERAGNLGCKLELSSSAKTGTRIQVCVEAQKAYRIDKNGAQRVSRLRRLMALRPRRQNRVKRSEPGTQAYIAGSASSATLITIFPAPCPSFP